MNKFLGFTKRNLLVYFKDKASVLFSMLSPLIVFALYMLFLKGTITDSLESHAQGLENFVSKSNIDALANGILLASIMGTSIITVPYQTLITLVKDREEKIDYDISATPMSRIQIIMSYFASACIAAFIMTSVVMAIGLVILCNNYDMNIGAMEVLKLVGFNLIGSICSTAMFMLITMFIKSTATSGALIGILSAASGFVIGAYIPLGNFSETVQTVCNIFPQTGVTGLIKKTLLSGILENIDSEIGGLDNGVFVQSIKDAFSLRMRVFENNLEAGQTLLYIAIITVVFIVLIGIVYPKIYKRK